MTNRYISFYNDDPFVSDYDPYDDPYFMDSLADHDPLDELIEEPDYTHNCAKCGKITTALSNYCPSCDYELDVMEVQEHERHVAQGALHADDIETALSNGKNLPAGWLRSIDLHF